MLWGGGGGGGGGRRRDPTAGVRADPPSPVVGLEGGPNTLLVGLTRRIYIYVYTYIYIDIYLHTYVFI